jgi:hypothetical protein
LQLSSLQNRRIGALCLVTCYTDLDGRRLARLEAIFSHFLYKTVYLLTTSFATILYSTRQQGAQILSDLDNGFDDSEADELFGQFDSPRTELERKTLNRDEGMTYWQGTRTVLNADGSVDIVRDIVRTQLVLGNVTFWNITAFVGSNCTEISHHAVVSIPGSDSAFKWTGELMASSQGSKGSKICAVLHKNGNAVLWRRDFQNTRWEFHHQL